jgi:hypothetical protein
MTNYCIKPVIPIENLLSLQKLVTPIISPATIVKQESEKHIGKANVPELLSLWLNKLLVQLVKRINGS